MDLERLRRVADTRPGYATWPDTAPGSPSWWRRPLPDRQRAADAAAAAPRPVDTPPTAGTPTATPDLCELVPLDGIGLVCARADHRHGQAVAAITPAAAVEVPAPDPVTAEMLAEALTAALSGVPRQQRRRRWWRRLAPWRADR